jgi:hypothetical protein
MGNYGIKVRVTGVEEDPVYVAVKEFLKKLGHLASDDDRGDHHFSGAPAVVNGVIVPKQRSSRCVTVHIMESLARRDGLFGPGTRTDNRFSLFIWSGFREKPGTLPFTEDDIGQRMMRYLVLVTDWEKHGLGESLFSAIGVRVVDILHEKPSKAEFVQGGAIGSSFRTLPGMGPKSHQSHASTSSGSYGSFSPPAGVGRVVEEDEESFAGARNGRNGQAKLRGAATPSS